MADIAELIVALKLRDGVSPGLGRLNGQLKGMGAGLSQVSRGVGQVGSGLDKIITRGAIAAGAALTGVITTAASFEQAFTGVEKTVEGTDAQLAELEETLRGMARTMPVAFEELAAIGEAGGALGVARDSLDEFIDVVARLAVSTDLTSEQAATALGQLGTILDLQGAQFEDFADSLVALGNAGASTESQIVELAARFAAAGNSAGLSNDEILALSSAVASMGIEVEAGGTALSQTFNNIATAIGTGADEVNAFTDLLGISAAEFKERWTRDALGTFTDFLTELAKLDQFEQSAVLEEAGITGSRQLNAIKLMTQNLGFFSDQLAVAEGAQGALDKESDKFFSTTQAQWKILQNNVRDAAATIGAELLPIVNEAIGDFVGFLSKPGTQAGIKDFAKSLSEGIRDFIAEIKKADFGPLIEVLKGAAEIAKAGFDAFRSLPPGVQSLALAAFGINKLTGGALTDIAKGFGNILGGGFKLFFERGSSPANPLWVQSVGGVGGGRGGLPFGTNTFGGGGGGLLGSLLKGAIIVSAGVFAFELGKFLATGSFGPGTPKVVREPFGHPERRGADAEAADSILLRDFAKKLPELATDEVIEHLIRTNEIGLKGVGTSFQVGLTNGLDPVGDTATRILARAEDPKAPAVMREIEGHISGLEEIQQTYLNRGDVALARKVQVNIDTLHELKGSTDTHRGVTQKLAADAVSFDQHNAARASAQVAELARNREQTGAKLLGLSSKYDTTNTILQGSDYKLASLLSKDFAPKVNVYNDVKVNVSAQTIQKTVEIAQTIQTGKAASGLSVR